MPVIVTVPAALFSTTVAFIATSHSGMIMHASGHNTLDRRKLQTLRGRPIGYSSLIGAKLVSHGRYVAFQMAEVAVTRIMFAEILRLIAELRPQPPPAPA